MRGGGLPSLVGFAEVFGGGGARVSGGACCRNQWLRARLPLCRRLGVRCLHGEQAVDDDGATTMRRTWRWNSATVSTLPGASVRFTTGCLLKASSAGPVAAHTKSGPRMFASQKSRSLVVMLACISRSNGVFLSTGRNG